MNAFLLVRSVYRTVELSGGWDGTIISTQWLFNVFDGGMVTLTIFALNIFHPGLLLRGPDHVAESKQLEETFSQDSFFSA
ncbi:hypothetical protein BC834DRAFT_971152 [Gloeopeniophorella convolvens]|nr:hypothetical protein BC834DRAFT_971152 [Gloeopeniophorella convolvens]